MALSRFTSPWGSHPQAGIYTADDGHPELFEALGDDEEEAGLPGDHETRRKLLMRWTASMLCVGMLHAGTVYAVVYWPREQAPAGEPPAAVMVELAPEAVAPDVPEQDVAVGIPQDNVQQPSDPTEDVKEPIEETKLEEPVKEPEKTEPPPEPIEEPVIEEVKPENDNPELVENDKAEAILEAPAKPQPEQEEPQEKPEEKEPEKEEKPEPPKKKPKPKPKPQQSPTVPTAPKPSDKKNAKVNAAPSSGTASSASIATWRGTVIAHLNRLKRSPGGARGTATVAFSIDRNGTVKSARLVRSSGNSALDKEALALVRRASPVPRPPANVPGNSLLMTAPVRIGR